MNNIFIETKLDNIFEQNKKITNDYNKLKLQYDTIFEQNIKLSNDLVNLINKNKNNVEIKYNGEVYDSGYYQYITINGYGMKIGPVDIKNKNLNLNSLNEYVKKPSQSINYRFDLYLTGHTEKVINYLLENKFYNCLKKLLFFDCNGYDKLKNLELIPFYEDIIKENKYIRNELKKIFDFEYVT